MNAGDVLLLEVQRAGPLPTEIDIADFDAIRLATARGNEAAAGLLSGQTVWPLHDSLARESFGFGRIRLAPC